MKEKTMKIIIAILLVLLLCVSAFWISDKIRIAREAKWEPVGTPDSRPVADQRPVSTASPTTSAASWSSGSDGEKEEPSSATSAPPFSSANEFGGSVRGKVVDASTSSLVLKEETTGKTLYFMRETAEIVGNLVVDAEAEVFYTGTLDQTDTSQVYVTKIVIYPS